MSYEPQIGPDGRDDEVTRLLRERYAAPQDPTYWDALASRIVTRALAEGEEWWAPYGHWVRSGLIAAGIAAVVTGAALVRSHDAQARVAYETIVETPRALPAQLATGTGDLPAREATLRYVIAP